MSEYIEEIERLADYFRRLDGIGKKTALRLAFSVLDMPQDDVEGFADALVAVKTEIGYCPVCHNISSGGLCQICSDERRDTTTVCVVEDFRAVAAIERAKGYNGLYHILHGAISPMKGIGPDDLTISALIERLKSGEVQEVIIATNPTVEGETTAVYLSRLITPLGVKVSRIANGVPVGGDLEYTDEMTMRRAIEGRYALD